MEDNISENDIKDVLTAYRILWASFQTANKSSDCRYYPATFELSSKIKNNELVIKTAKPLEIIGWPYKNKGTKPNSLTSLDIVIELMQTLEIVDTNGENTIQVKSSTIRVCYYKRDKPFKREPIKPMEVLEIVHYDTDLN